MSDKKVPCEVYSRIVGYFRPVRRGAQKLWNVGAVQMHDDRVMYQVPRGMEARE